MNGFVLFCYVTSLFVFYSVSALLRDNEKLKKSQDELANTVNTLEKDRAKVTKRNAELRVSLQRLRTKQHPTAQPQTQTTTTHTSPTVSTSPSSTTVTVTATTTESAAARQRRFSNDALDISQSLSDYMKGSNNLGLNLGLTDTLGKKTGTAEKGTEKAKKKKPEVQPRFLDWLKKEPTSEDEEEEDYNSSDLSSSSLPWSSCVSTTNNHRSLQAPVPELNIIRIPSNLQDMLKHLSQPDEKPRVGGNLGLGGLGLGLGFSFNSSDNLSSLFSSFPSSTTTTASSARRSRSRTRPTASPPSTSAYTRHFHSRSLSRPALPSPSVTDTHGHDQGRSRSRSRRRQRQHSTSSRSQSRTRTNKQSPMDSSFLSPLGDLPSLDDLFTSSSASSFMSKPGKSKSMKNKTGFASGFGLEKKTDDLPIVTMSLRDVIQEYPTRNQTTNKAGTDKSRNSTNTLAPPTNGNTHTDTSNSLSTPTPTPTTVDPVIASDEATLETPLSPPQTTTTATTTTTVMTTPSAAISTPSSLSPSLSLASSSSSKRVTTPKPKPALSASKQKTPNAKPRR